MLPAVADRPKLAAVLGQLSSAVEELLLSGLTTASEATRQAIGDAFEVAARLRLARLASTLRSTQEEISRYISQDPGFSMRRMTFFLTRTWILSRGMSKALETLNETQFDKLCLIAPTEFVESFEAVCIGIVKRVSAGAFNAFEFRLRAVKDSKLIRAGEKLVASKVYRADPGVPAEAYLHIAQNKFKGNTFLEKKVLAIRNTNLADDVVCKRVSLTDQTEIDVVGACSNWQQFLDWSTSAARDRIRKHVAGPLDVETEMHEEIAIRDYTIGEGVDGGFPGRIVYPITAGPLTFSALASSGVDGKSLRDALATIRKLKSNRPPLYGLLHYERSQLVFQPVSAFSDEPEYLQISKEKSDKAALVKSFKYT